MTQLTDGSVERGSPARREAHSAGVARRVLAAGVLLIVAVPIGLAAGAQRGGAALSLLSLAFAGWLCFALVTSDRKP